MPIDMQKLIQNKEAIISIIKSKGPCLPVQIAREVNLSMLFASAYLSEIYNERKIKMSSMKVGSSPLYYVSGQEALLENFIQYLNHKEKEAFALLKKEKLLNDEKMEPAIRVALRSIKDFAVPIRIKLDHDSKLFWKHFLINDEEIKDIAQELLSPKKERKIKGEKDEDRDKQETLVKPRVEDNLSANQEIKLKNKISEDVKDHKRDELEQLKQKIEKMSQEMEKPTVIPVEKENR